MRAAVPTGKLVVACLALACVVSVLAHAQGGDPAMTGRVLYNGITLPAVWPSAPIL